MTEEVIKDLQRRLSIVENLLMTPVVTRKDIKILTGFGAAIIIIGILMFAGELYILNKIDKVYALLLLDE